METEQTKRSILKTITWRITASLDTFVIAWIITGDWRMGGTIAGIEVLTKMFFYYFHERIWNKIKWGKKKWWWLSKFIRNLIGKVSNYSTSSGSLKRHQTFVYSIFI